MLLITHSFPTDSECHTVDFVPLWLPILCSIACADVMSCLAAWAFDLRMLLAQCVSRLPWGRELVFRHMLTQA
jgi:hypothetical protein